MRDRSGRKRKKEQIFNLIAIRVLILIFINFHFYSFNEERFEFENNSSLCDFIMLY